MLRITDQYFWNFVFVVFFIILFSFAVVVVGSEAFEDVKSLTVIELVLLSLASLRLTRFFTTDDTTKFFREQFWNAKKVKGGYVLVKPVTGPRRTLADITSSAWSFGLFSTMVVAFLYFVVPYGTFVVLLLAIAALGSLLQIFTDYLGHRPDGSL